MTPSIDRLLLPPAPLSLLVRLVLLVAVLSICTLFLSPLAWLTGRLDGVLACLAAAAFCFAGGFAASVVCEFLRGPKLAIYHTLVGTMLRMGLPLGLFVVVVQQRGPLVDAGIGYYLIPTYLAMLAVETFLAIGQLKASEATVKA